MCGLYFKPNVLPIHIKGCFTRYEKRVNSTIKESDENYKSMRKNQKLKETLKDIVPYTS
jgi:hypothetical protein